LGKIMTETERSVYMWLLKKYKPDEVKYNYRGSPDFELIDGRRIEVKRIMFGTIFFSKKQWESLDGDVEIIIMGDGSEPIAIIPFSKIKELKSNGKLLELKDKKCRIVVSAEEERLQIRCSRETYNAFRKYAADYKNYEEALRSLLAKAGVLREAIVF